MDDVFTFEYKSLPWFIATTIPVIVDQYSVLIHELFSILLSTCNRLLVNCLFNLQHLECQIS